MHDNQPVSLAKCYPRILNKLYNDRGELPQLQTLSFTSAVTVINTVI